MQMRAGGVLASAVHDIRGIWTTLEKHCGYQEIRG